MCVCSCALTVNFFVFQHLPPTPVHPAKDPGRTSSAHTHKQTVLVCPPPQPLAQLLEFVLTGTPTMSGLKNPVTAAIDFALCGQANKNPRCSPQQWSRLYQTQLLSD